MNELRSGYVAIHPLLSDENRQLWKDASIAKWFAKIEEEVLAAHEAAIVAKSYPTLFQSTLAEKLTNVITVCVSYLNALGYDEAARGEVQRKVNARNSVNDFFETYEEMVDKEDG